MPGSNDRVIVVDNNSTDNTKKIIKEKFQQVRLIENTENLGFGKANNIGLRMAYNDDADFFFLLNQDAWVEKNTIQVLVEKLKENKDYGIISPMQFFDMNSLDKKFKSYISRSNLKNWNNLTKEEVERIYQVGFVNAAVWMMSRKCVETVGIFAPVFSHYGEDQNFCHRCKFHRLKVGVTPGARAFHEREQNPENSKDLKTLLTKDKNYCLAVLLNLKHSFIRQWFFLLFTSLKNWIVAVLLLRFKAAFVILSRIKMLFRMQMLIQVRNVTKKPGAYLN